MVELPHSLFNFPNMFRYRKLLLKATATAVLLLGVLPQNANAQSDSTLSKKEIRKNRSTFIQISAGLNSVRFRDFATSPLIYKGTIGHFDVARVRVDRNRTISLGGSYSFGSPSLSTNEHSASSSFKTFSMHYTRLYGIDLLEGEKWTTKVGGTAVFTGNFRINSSFQNNALGLELFPTLFGAFQVERDISRTEAKEKKIWFVKYSLKPRVRSLSYRLNLGLINSHYRNGYVYADQSAVLNKPNIFGGYSFDLFSGFRMGSDLQYTHHLENNNRIQLSYHWDVLFTGGDFDRFEMAQHIVKFSLYFKTNNK